MFQQIAKLRKRRESGEGGFTLIELLVVIIILGVLSAVVVFAVRGTGDKGKTSAIKIDARTIKSAQAAYCAKTGSFGTTEQLTGEAPAADGNTYKFLSEKPTYNNVVMTGGNQCGTDPLTSGYVLTSGGPLNPGGGGTFITQGSYNPPNLLNPAVTTAGTIQPTSAPLFNGLTGLAANATAVPELAESWKITNGGAKYKFILRPGVVWSDSVGTSGPPPYRPLMAEDVKFSYEAALLIWHARTSASVRSALSPLCTEPTGAAGNESRRLNCGGIVANEADTAEPNNPVTGLPPRTVTFNFARPYGPLLLQTTLTDGAIIPSHIWPVCTNTGAGFLGTAATTDLSCPRPSPSASQSWPGNPVGTGPFVVNVTETGPGPDFVYDKNTKYWRTGIPYFNKMKATAVGANLAGLQGGAVDYLTGVGGVQAAKDAKADSSLVVDTGSLAPGGSSNCTRTVMFNLWKNEFSAAQIKATGGTPGTNFDIYLGDPNDGLPVVGFESEGVQSKGLLVRKAIAMALGREPNVNGLTPGNAGYASLADSFQAKMAQSPTNSNMAVGYTPAPLPAYNKAKAEAYLNAAGWPDTNGATAGGRFSLGYTALGSDDPVSQAIRANILAVGITIVANPARGAAALFDSPNFANRYFDVDGTGKARNFDVLLVSSCQGTDPEMGTRRVYHSDAITPVPFSNGSGYYNTTVDGWFNDARASLDPAVRNSFYKKINDQVALDLPTLWLTETVSTRAWRAICSGFRPWTGAYAEYGSCLK